MHRRSRRGRRRLEFRTAALVALGAFERGSLALAILKLQSQRRFDGAGGTAPGAPRERRGPTDRQLTLRYGHRATRAHRQGITAQALQPLGHRRSLRHRDALAWRPPRRQTHVEQHGILRRREVARHRAQRHVVRSVGRAQHVRLPRGRCDDAGRFRLVHGGHHGFERGALRFRQFGCALCRCHARQTQHQQGRSDARSDIS